MPFKRVPQKFNASLTEVTIGTGGKTVTLGGENVLPLYSFDGEIKNPPKVGIEISDKGPHTEIPGLAKFYGDDKSVVAAAKKACTAPGADFIALVLESADPNGDNKPIEDEVKLCKEVADVVTLPLVIVGSRNVEQDAKLLPEVAKALEGKNVLLLSCKEENYKQIAVAGVMAYKQKVAAESAVDINLAKQVNVLIGQQGVTNENMVMQPGTATAGYGFEYVISAMDRIRAAALAQNDKPLQLPIITPVSQETWNVKESSLDEKEAAKGWGPAEDRAITMEICTAASVIAAGSNAVILRHPQSIATISKMVKELV